PAVGPESPADHQVLRALQRAHLLPRGRIPDLELPWLSGLALIAATRDQSASIVAEGQPDAPRRPAGDVLAGHHIPNAQLVTNRGQEPAVGMEGDAADNARRPLHWPLQDQR